MSNTLPMGVLLGTDTKELSELLVGDSWEEAYAVTTRAALKEQSLALKKQSEREEACGVQPYSLERSSLQRGDRIQTGSLESQAGGLAEDSRQRGETGSLESQTGGLAEDSRQRGDRIQTGSLERQAGGLVEDSHDEIQTESLESQAGGLVKDSHDEIRTGSLESQAGSLVEDSHNGIQRGSLESKTGGLSHQRGDRIHGSLESQAGGLVDDSRQSGDGIQEVEEWMSGFADDIFKGGKQKMRQTKKKKREERYIRGLEKHAREEEIGWICPQKR